MTRIVVLRVPVSIMVAQLRPPNIATVTLVGLALDARNVSLVRYAENHYYLF